MIWLAEPSGLVTREFYVGGESDDQFEVRFSGRRPQLKKRIPVKMEAGVKFEDKPELFQSLNG